MVYFKILWLILKEFFLRWDVVLPSIIFGIVMGFINYILNIKKLYKEE
jgi:hypothetical protein